MIQMTRLDGPWERETFFSRIDQEYITIYYHIDSGFGGTCNECVRVWYADHNAFNDAHY